jgi:hypothetical protein
VSTRTDVLDARAIFGIHTDAHKCRAGECAVRTALWLRYMSTAERWNEPQSVADEPGRAA